MEQTKKIIPSKSNMMNQGVNCDYLQMNVYWWGALYSNIGQQKKLQYWKVCSNMGDNLMEAESESPVLSYSCTSFFI